MTPQNHTPTVKAVPQEMSMLVSVGKAYRLARGFLHLERHLFINTTSSVTVSAKLTSVLPSESGLSLEIKG